MRRRCDLTSRICTGRAIRWGGRSTGKSCGINFEITSRLLPFSQVYRPKRQIANVWDGSSVFKHDPLRPPRICEMEAISRPIRSAPWISRPSPSHSVSEMGKTERKKEGGSRLQSRGVLLRRSNADGSWKERLGSRGDPQGQVAWQWLVAPELRRHRVWTRIWKNDAGIINHA